MRLFGAILGDLEHTAAFGEAEQWMTPVHVEAYVRERLRLTPTGWAPWVEALAGRGPQTRIDMVNQLVDLIAFNGMCFGDGPRWRVNMLHGWVEQWIQTTAAGPEGVGLWA
jgi:hypothetical protein